MTRLHKRIAKRGFRRGEGRSLRDAAWALALLLLAIGADSCCSCRESAHCTPGDDAPYTITYSSGGGFSGRHAGYVISSDGRIWKTGGFPRREEERELVDSLRQDDICLLRKFMESQRLDTLHQKETGNMTTTLSFVKGESVLYDFSWNGTMSEQDLVPKALVPTVQRIQALLPSAGK